MDEKRLSTLNVPKWFVEKSLSFFHDDEHQYWVYRVIGETEKAINISINAEYYDKYVYVSEPPTSALFIKFYRWIPKSIIFDNKLKEHNNDNS